MSAERNFEDVNERWQAERDADHKKTLAAKEEIMGQLARLLIATVEVKYDGYGDEGQVEMLTATKDDESEVKLAPEIEGRIIELCYGLLATEHGGWVNNEGSYGTFQFDVPAKTIALAHNARTTESTDSTF
jgi:hypothetical protein